MSNFQSTSFYLNQWSNKSLAKIEINRRDPILLDIVESTSTREVCKGDGCGLFYESDDQSYQTVGDCVRTTLCTETRILRDKVYVKTGSNSNTVNCISHPNQLKTW